ncbi:MAG: hypothetical protein HC888_05200 [Candidatus Competibacteraceae bacterium]|nr:hypothetical protein [Candidatus Competibacteraceae bacterium]
MSRTECAHNSSGVFCQCLLSLFPFFFSLWYKLIVAYRRISFLYKLVFALGITFSFAQAQALTGTQLSLIKLMNTSPVTVDLRSVGDVIIQLRRKVTDNPHDGNLRLRLGTYLYLAGDLQGAASEMKRAVAISPEDYLAHILLARVLDLSMDEASAELEFKRAIAINADVAEAHYYFAESLFRRGEISEAVNEYRLAARLKPSDQFLSGLSQALLAARDIHGAIKAGAAGCFRRPILVHSPCRLDQGPPGSR